MSGVAIVAALLVADAAPIGVAATNIKGGGLPQEVTLPNLLVTSISSVGEDDRLSGPHSLLTERVQVTVRAGAYRQQKLIEAAVRRSCDSRSGLIAGFAVLDLRFAGSGPDFAADDTIWMGSLDFRVTYRP